MKVNKISIMFTLKAKFISYFIVTCKVNFINKGLGIIISKLLSQTSVVQ